MLSDDDRELLELAAKAAGIPITPHPNYRISRNCQFVSGGRNWNPLTDDGDALRLAVKVGQLYMIRIEIGRSGVDVDFDAHIAEAFSRGDDIAACARRAIVRAAAEIGRQHD